MVAVFISALMVIGVVFSGIVSADSWWGDGAKTHKWILKHGGSLIRFEIINRKGDASEYKVILTKKGRNVEVEVGKDGIFDDALPGEYKVTFYRGGNGQKSFSGKGKDVGSIKLDVHAGEQIWLKFNYEKRKISMTTDYVKPVPKVKNPVVPAPVPKKQKTSLQQKSQKNLEKEAEQFDKNEDKQPEDISKQPEYIPKQPEYIKTVNINSAENIFKRKNCSLSYAAGAFCSNNAEINENAAIIKPDDSELSFEQTGFLRRIWLAVVNFFKF